MTPQVSIPILFGMKTTRHIGYCPVCNKDFKVRSGLLVHHGYRRPGFGFIVGDCMGALRIPHETSPDLAAEYRDMLAGWLRQDVEKLKFLSSKTRLPLMVGREKVWVEKFEAPEGGYDWDGGGSLELYDRVQKWDRAYAQQVSGLKHSIEHLTSEVARVTHLYDSWTKKELTTVDETVAAKREAKAERDAKKAADREAKIAKAVESYQKRIDSAVKNGNASTLHGIYESAQRKLPDLSGYTRGQGYAMTKEEATTRLDRDNVWEAFGLITADGPLAYNDVKAKGILSDMYGKRLDPIGLDGWPNRMGGKLADDEVAKWIVGEWVNSDWSGNRPTADIKVTAAFKTKKAALMANDYPFKMETPAPVRVGELLTLVDHYLSKPQGIVAKKENAA